MWESPTDGCNEVENKVAEEDPDVPPAVRVLNVEWCSEFVANLKYYQWRGKTLKTESRLTAYWQ